MTPPIARGRWPTACVRGRWTSSSARSTFWRRASRCGCRSSATTSARIIFWGPPGTGKTTLAKIIARCTQAEFVEFSAVLAGIKEIKQVMAEAERGRQYGTRTIVFIDEIHRFNKAQQDAFLPHVEKRQHPAHRRDHREPVVRDHLRPALALPRLHPEPAD